MVVAPCPEERGVEPQAAKLSQSLPEDPYGRRNRQAIAAREARAAARLRTAELVYWMAMTTPSALQPTGQTS